MRRTLSVVLAAGLLLGAPQARAAEPESQPNVQVVQLQTIYAEAQQRVDRYNSTRDTTHLVVAHELLVKWLADHAVVYANVPQAAQMRQPVEQQLAMVDAELQRRATQTTPPPQPVMVRLEPAPEPVDPALAAADREAEPWIRGGTSTLSLGLITTLAVALPLWAARNSALRNAHDARFRVDEERYIGRAKRRQTASIISASIGVPLVVLGTALISVGVSKRRQARRRLSLTPKASRSFAGASLTLRF